MTETQIVLLTLAITAFVALIGLVSAIGGAILAQIFIGRREEKKKRVEFLERQIKEVYGPIVYFLSKSEKAIKRSEAAIDSLGGLKDFDYEGLPEEFQKLADINWDEATKKLIGGLVKEIWENNREIEGAIKANFLLIDPDDYSLVDDIVFDSTGTREARELYFSYRFILKRAPLFNENVHGIPTLEEATPNTYKDPGELRLKFKEKSDAKTKKWLDSIGAQT